MLNELITWVLNTYLGKYLENFNPAQLSVALMSGEVELENVPIRKDALRSFGIPVQAISGNIGKVKLQIPVRQFRTASWCIIIERMYGVFGPKNLDDWDDEKERSSEFEFKLSQLDAKEAKWRVESGEGKGNYYSSSYSSWLNYGTTFATSILENLELKIIDVHIRYEDALTIHNVPFAAGIKIKSLSVQSCDSNWISGTKILNNQDISYKLIELKDFSVYWDSLSEQNTCIHLTSKSLLSQMNDLTSVDEHQYIISPITARAQCKRERCKQSIRSKQRPRLSCEVVIPAVKVALSDLQYRQAVDCLNSLNNISVIRSYRITRPKCGISQGASQWWKYAAKCHGFSFYAEEKKWLTFRENLRYIQLYKCLLINPNENISAEDKEFKLQMERERSLTELETMRSVCYTNVYIKDLNLKTQNINQSKSMLFHWFPNWWGWYGNTESQTQAQDEDYKKIENDILNALEDSIENDTFSKRDTVFGYFTFILVEGSFLVYSKCTDGKNGGKFEMDFENLTSFLEIKPKFSSYLLGISLGSVCLKDMLTKGTEYPYLIQPQIKEVHPTSAAVTNSHTSINIKTIFDDSSKSNQAEPWFKLQYEKGPAEVSTDFRLVIKSKSLDIVYNENAFQWLISFFAQPLPKLNFKSEQNENKNRLKFLKNWKHYLLESKEQRKTWSFEIDISAPRILFVENFLEKNSTIVLVDFGRFQLLKNETRNEDELIDQSVNDKNCEYVYESDDENDLFITPCSTPPGSKISCSESPKNTQDPSAFTKFVINNNTGLEDAFHSKMYDKYIINLTDLQVLVCKNREQSFNIFKNSTNLLNKFNISLELERRVIYTMDPEYPSLTLCGVLPKLVAHINEQKINDVFKVVHLIKFENILKSTSNNGDNETANPYEEPLEFENSANLVIVQFDIGQMILEVQTYEKSVAELQVIGIRAGVTKKPMETNINMSVHGLLLVDAIQSFGPDFELLVASHRHVGMDSVSGSLKQSEPCSPVSPASPDPLANQRPLSPYMINRAVTHINAGNIEGTFGLDDMHTLISIEINVIEPGHDSDCIQIANITFNNLDIIANQETIVELLGFGKRIAYIHDMFASKKDFQNEVVEVNAKETKTEFPFRSTEITFDFHRLNILVLRTFKKENYLVARKVGTLTMSEAKIQAVFGKNVFLTGSLGGIQIIDITPEGINHQRIFSVGKDPLTDPPNIRPNDLLSTLASEMYCNAENIEDEQMNALIFKISHEKGSHPNIKVRMASVWYTHCPNFIQEINSCVSQFKHYLKNFARSLRDKATDMAIGLVQHISDDSINVVTKKEGVFNLYSATFLMDIILNSPVLVLPRSRKSYDVLVANLGKITAYNTNEDSGYSISNAQANNKEESCMWKKDNYFIDVRNINLFSLNTSQRKELRLSALPKANEFYSCKNDAVAILHDTAVLFKFTKDSKKSKVGSKWNIDHTLWIEGSVTQLLQVSLSRLQYEQLTESLCNAMGLNTNTDFMEKRSEKFNKESNLKSTEENISSKRENYHSRIKFSIPVLKMDLKNEHDNCLINITFREFNIERTQKGNETELEVLLRSILMEDLKCALDSSFRNMVNSMSDYGKDSNCKVTHYSMSCPNLTNLSLCKTQSFGSMPSKLDETSYNYISTEKLQVLETRSSHCKASDENLVKYRSKTTELFSSNAINKDVKSSIDFNCLNLIISVDRWFMVLDFFGLVSSNEVKNKVSEKEEISEEINFANSELRVSVRSLNLILVRNEEALSRANISNLFFKVCKENFEEIIDGRLGSISLLDLTAYGSLYREKFSTSGPEVLNFSYKRFKPVGETGQRSLNKDALLKIQMTSVRYIHTKRFLMEIHLFIKELLQLQAPVIHNIKASELERENKSQPIHICLEIHSESPIILLPLSYNSNQLIVADLGEFTLTNSFHFSNESNIISKRQDSNMLNEILDVMFVDLVNINLFAGERAARVQSNADHTPFEYFNIGNFIVLKQGKNLFQEKCFLKLQIERNTEAAISHNCPDISVKGTLSKLNGIVNLQQYKLIRGFLNYNLGEPIDDVYFKYTVNVCESIDKLNSRFKLTQLKQPETVWNTMSINLLLENVAILLTNQQQSTTEKELQNLACIKFIKSSLEIDSFSDGSQDIDLISTEILIMDSRNDDTQNTSADIFKYILKPTRGNSSNSVVQAEIHSRRKPGSSKYTILLNNMRIIAILDCLESLKNFLKEEPFISSAAVPMWTNNMLTYQSNANLRKEEENTDILEVVLNITDSEVVFIENLGEVDTNAVILKSTTVFSYKPKNSDVPISININHLEIFSCILDAEDETALSIIDPFTLNVELRNNCFSVTIHKHLCIRLSYNDFKLFTKMLRSIPKQTKSHRKSQQNTVSDIKGNFELIAPLIAMGFSQKDAWYAMEMSNYKLNEAALWLSQQKQPKSTSTSALLAVHNVVVNANRISVCIIDDCLDADVPLLEISFSRLNINQKLKHKVSEDVVCVPPFIEGFVEAVVASDYYNRRLSGWEPVIEMWECSAKWKISEINAAKWRTVNINVASKQLLKLNVTSTLIELCDLVHDNWTKDYYGGSSESPTNFRRRSPFIPFALQNLTGEPLIFKTIFSQPGGFTYTEANQQDIMRNWVAVQPNELIPFDFGHHTKLRHMDSHKLNMHQILVQILGWTLVGPISIDKVGTFFRHSTLDLHYKKRTRIVFDILLMGSAQKLIVVRSALNIVNKINKRLFLKMELKNEDKNQLTFIEPNQKLSVPLKLVDSFVFVKPFVNLQSNEQLCENILKDSTNFVSSSLRRITTDYDDFGFCTQGISWMDCAQYPVLKQFSCYRQKKTVFHILAGVKQDKFPSREVINLPGHTITLLPPLKLKNMLCCDVLYKINGTIEGRIAASETVEIYSVNPFDSFSLSLTCDNYKLSGQLKIPAGHSGVVEPKLKLIDQHNRELYLRISIQSFPEKSMEIYISASLWIINRTGLPLVFRQEGTNHIASGQFEEHERARVVSPLLFSFSDQDGLPSLEIRLGKSYGASNPWCKGFNIHKEIIYRELKAERSGGCYAIGINVHRGRGLYTCTTFITLTPRFQLFNKTIHTLQFAQKCDIKSKEATVEKLISALPGCSFPFHWPNCEQEPLLCVRVADFEFCHWSNSIPINEAQSLYINVRNDCGEMCFLRLEVISKGATYLLLFSDAHTLPPPIRIDNYSEVLIHFYQNGCKPHWRTTVRPKSSLAYVLDDPMGTKSLQIEVPGGNSVVFPLNKIDVSCDITYANFIYIAFRETFSSGSLDGSILADISIHDQQLVLGVKDKKVIIMQKCAGDRSQLWLMNSNGQLEHEGSSPPTEFAKAQDSFPRMVLDLEKAPNPTEYTNLVIRPPNKQRVTTQTWRFENGRLMCHANMCVQARDGMYGLRAGCDAVLGRIEPISRTVNAHYVPFEQSIEIQKLRPGSGHLEIKSKMDGPIQTIQIHDTKANSLNIILSPDPSWSHASIQNQVAMDDKNSNVSYEFSLKCDLQKGLGVSIITRQPCEELAYLTFENITLHIFSTPLVTTLEFKVFELQIDNQLLDTSCPILLHTSKIATDEPAQCALTLFAKMLPCPNKNAVIFENLSFDIKPCIVYLEERLILKTAFFLGFGQMNLSSTNIEFGHEAHNNEDRVVLRSCRRFYFESLKLGPTQIRLSVLTATKLTPELYETKKAIGLALIKFEDALIEFDKLLIKHNFETFDVYLKKIKIHYVNQLKWHAASILGSVDFLGNPLGFANDLTEGVSGLIFEGSVRSLVKNVAHGISNSTAKLTETLSEGLGKVVLDEHDNETRQKILELQSNTSGGHLTAGLKGFGFGLLGGVTSIVRHTYDGAQSDGFPGFLSGLGKGLVGTVTKPIIGVLDLASETATAVRESSKGSHRCLPDRKRLPRCVTGAPGGLLPTYSYRQSKGQQYLHVINRRNFTEKLIAYEPNLCNDRDAKLRLLVSTECIRVFSRCDEDPAIMFECHLSEVLSCHPLTANVGNSSSTSKAAASYYIEITINLPKITRPRVRCQSEEIAENAARCAINLEEEIILLTNRLRRLEDLLDTNQNQYNIISPQLQQIRQAIETHKINLSELQKDNPKIQILLNITYFLCFVFFVFGLYKMLQ